MLLCLLGRLAVLGGTPAASALRGMLFGFVVVWLCLRKEGYSELPPLPGAGRHLLFYREPAGAEEGHLGEPYRPFAGGGAEDAARRPFHIDAWVVLPDHMHCIWTLPPGDDDFSNRWKAIKIRFVQALPRTERRSKVSVAKGERGVWHRRFWEHAIRDQRDYNQHVDYIHMNPLKPGHVKKVADWPYSSFHRYVRDGILSANWMADETELDVDVVLGEVD